MQYILHPVKVSRANIFRIETNSGSFDAQFLDLLSFK
jgi:hypothetical protein